MKTFQPAEIRRYLHKQVADMYGISRVTLYRWLKPLADELGKRNGYWYSAEQMKIIFERFGVPMIAVVTEVAVQTS